MITNMTWHGNEHIYNMYETDKKNVNILTKQISQTLGFGNCLVKYGLVHNYDDKYVKRPALRINTETP